MSSPAELQIENLEAWRDWLRARHSTAPGPWRAEEKVLVRRLALADQLERSGIAAVARSRRNGSWRACEQAKLLKPPLDLTLALVEEPGLHDAFDLLQPNIRNALLAWASSPRRMPRREKLASILAVLRDVDRDALPWWTRRSFVPRDEPATAPTVETKIQRLTGRALERVHRTHGVAVIRGPSGIGKRHAARTFQARPGAKAAMIQPLDPRSSP